MNADIKGALNQLNVSWKAFVHNGKPMTKPQVKAVLEFGVKMGYKTTAELQEEDVTRIIKSLS